MIMRGIWFSLEQCGHLLQDAVSLLREGRYATAVGLAMIARDELGKYKALLELWNRANAGAAVTTRDLPRDHVVRQKFAALSATLGEGDDAERQEKFEALRSARTDEERRLAFEALGDGHGSSSGGGAPAGVLPPPSGYAMRVHHLRAA